MIVLYIMLSGWEKFKGWKVLEFFLSGNKSMHCNGLARELDIAVATAQTYLSAYEREGILEKEKSANSIFYRLKETAFTQELKKAFFLSKLSGFVGQFQKDNPLVTTFALYGSHAKGTFDENSDVDLIAFVQGKKVKLDALKKLEHALGKEAKLQVFSLAEWKKLVQAGNPFAQVVQRTAIVLAGEPL